MKHTCDAQEARLASRPQHVFASYAFSTLWSPLWGQLTLPRTASVCADSTACCKCLHEMLTSEERHNETPWAPVPSKRNFRKKLSPESLRSQALMDSTREDARFWLSPEGPDASLYSPSTNTALNAST